MCVRIRVCARISANRTALSMSIASRPNGKKERETDGIGEEEGKGEGECKSL